MTQPLTQPLRVAGDTPWCVYKVVLESSSEAVVITDIKSGDVIGHGYAIGIYPMDAESPELDDFALDLKISRVADANRFTIDDLKTIKQKLAKQRKHVQNKREQEAMVKQVTQHPCRHLGKHTGETECKTCAGNMRLKVFSCSVHTKCTIAKEIDEHACCVICPDYLS